MQWDQCNDLLHSCRQIWTDSGNFQSRLEFELQLLLLTMNGWSLWSDATNPLISGQTRACNWELIISLILSEWFAWIAKCKQVDSNIQSMNGCCEEDVITDGKDGEHGVRRDEEGGGGRGRILRDAGRELSDWLGESAGETTPISMAIGIWRPIIFFSIINPTVNSFMRSAGARRFSRN